MAKTNETPSREVTIRYQVSNRQWRTETKEKTFKSEAAMQKWVAKQEEKDNWCGIIAYSYEETAQDLLEEARKIAEAHARPGVIGVSSEFLNQVMREGR